MNFLRDSACERIFAIWRHEAFDPSHALRGGMRYCDICEDIGEWDHSRCQSLAEHEFGVKSLVESVMKFYSDLLKFSPEEREVISKVASLHDFPEALLSGDIVANGTRNDKVEDEKEYALLERRLKFLYPELYAQDLLTCYKEFQRKNSLRGWLLYLADKTDAILTVTLFPQNAKTAGRVDTHGIISSTVERQIEITGSVLPYECWLVTLFDDIIEHLRPEYDDISEIFLKTIFTGRAHSKIMECSESPCPDWLISTYSKEYQHSMITGADVIHHFNLLGD